MARSNALNGKLVVLIGGSGFLGSHVAQALLERGARLRIASRNPKKAWPLKPLANLGQLQFVRCDVTRRESVAAALHGADAVVNLAAAWGAEGHEVMAKGSAIAAQEAASQAISDFVQISSIGADPEGLTNYARDKAAGEAAVRAAVPKATILRPSVIYGNDDKFISMFARMIATFPVLPVFAPQSQLQVVWVDDVAEAVAVALEDRDRAEGKIYELAGPERPSVLEINQAIAAGQGRDRTFLPLPDAVSSMIALIPFGPITRDQWLMLKQGNVASGKLPGFDQLGVEAHPLSLFLERWMARYRKHGRFSPSGAAA